MHRLLARFNGWMRLLRQTPPAFTVPKKNEFLILTPIQTPDQITMKKPSIVTNLGLIGLISCSLCAQQAAQAASTLPFTDHFAYGTGNLGSVGTAGNWNGSSTAATMTTGNLDGTGL